MPPLKCFRVFSRLSNKQIDFDLTLISRNIAPFSYSIFLSVSGMKVFDSFDQFCSCLNLVSLFQSNVHFFLIYPHIGKSSIGHTYIEFISQWPLLNNIARALTLSNLIIQKLDLHQNGVEFCQQFNGAIRTSLTTQFNGVQCCFIALA